MSHESEILRLEDELIAERREFAAENRARIAAEREIERWREWAERAKAAIQRGIDAKARQRAEVARYREVYCEATMMRDALETIATAAAEPEVDFEPTLEWAQAVARDFVDSPATCDGCVDEQCLDEVEEYVDELAEDAQHANARFTS
jgi:chromosome segregation ATPase